MTKFAEDIKAMREISSVYDERSLVVERKQIKGEKFPLGQLMVATAIISGALCAIAASFILQW